MLRPWFDIVQMQARKCGVTWMAMDCTGADVFVWWLLVQVISLPNGARSLPPQLVKMLERLVSHHQP